MKHKRSRHSAKRQRTHNFDHSLNSAHCPKLRLSAVALAVRVGVIGLGVVHGATHAATLTITSSSDLTLAPGIVSSGDGSCTLREAISSLNARISGLDCPNSGAAFGNNDTIVFNASVFSPATANNVIRLPNGALRVYSTNYISSSITLDAFNIDGGVTLDGDNSGAPVFDVNAASLGVSNITITGGNFTGVNAGGSGIVANQSEINIINSTVSGNLASSIGGGINAANGTVIRLFNSTVSGNVSGGFGGGVYANYATIELTNSTISSNSASLSGGALVVGNGNLSLNNSTISDNTAPNSGGLIASMATVNLDNSIIANSSDQNDVTTIVGVTIDADSASIIEQASFGGSRTGDPGLLPLTDNGANTQTHALNQASIARNTGITASCEETDQRGQIRNSGDGFCDVGAVEFASIVVNSNADEQINDANCTLREAMVSINFQNLQGGCDVSDGSDLISVVTFANNLANTITLQGQQLVAFRDTSIDASGVAGGITIAANSEAESRGIFVNSATLNLENITIAQGVSSAGGGGIFANNGSTVNLNNSMLLNNRAVEEGAGILALGNANINLNNSTVSANIAGASGGGIFGNVFTYGNGGPVINLSNSTVSGNAAYESGGGIFGSSAAINLSNSTISGNVAYALGGGIGANLSVVNAHNSTVSGNVAATNGSAIAVFNTAAISLRNSTVSDNIQLNSSGNSVFASLNANINLVNSIIANSSDNQDIELASGASISADSASIIEQASYDASRSGDPGLLPLANNGGATQTHALSVNSTARNTGDLNSCTRRDQRDQLRNDGDNACDVGAIEFNPNDGAGFFVIPLGDGRVVVVPL